MAGRKACFDVGRSQLHGSLKEQPVTSRMEEESATKQPEDLSMDRRDEFSGTRGKVARDFYRAASESKLLHQPTLWSVPQQPGEQGLAPWAWLPRSHTNPWGQKVRMALHGPRPHRGLLQGWAVLPERECGCEPGWSCRFPERGRLDGEGKKWSKPWEVGVLVQKGPRA